MKQSLVQRLTIDVVKQMLLDNFLDQIGCVRVYQVRENWHAEELKKSDKTYIVHNVRDFRKACEATDGLDIFVVKEAAMTQSQAESIMKTVTTDRTVFWQANT